MQPNDLVYSKLIQRIQPTKDSSGLGESPTFLLWFLTNIYRLDDTAARDCICDHPIDKGIDGIYVDHNNEEIHFLQSKIRQKESGTIGDTGLKGLMASIQQFSTPEKVESVIQGNADSELKHLLQRTQMADMVRTGYQLVGIYVTNEKSDQDAAAYLKLTPNLRVFSRQEIANAYIDVDASEGVKGDFTFDVSYVDPLVMEAGGGKSKQSMYVFPARAMQLVHLKGISDGKLFKNNVRYELGNTSVNKSIRRSIGDKPEHPNFVLFHNGIIILCAKVTYNKPDELTITDYSVVNGAQSLTSFYNEKSKLTDDLRVLVRIVGLQDEVLARKITENSNNQNAIKPRDLRSNHAIMVRLQHEVSEKSDNYFFEIKRGEAIPAGRTAVSNDAIGRCLLAFDVQEPWSAHQIYKIFDEKYSEIFGRPEVDAYRIIFVYRVMIAVDKALDSLKNRPMASYTLTRYFLAYMLSLILRSREESESVVAKPNSISDKAQDDFFTRCDEILKTVIVDLNYEAASPGFDYKSLLKSPKQCTDLANSMLASYEKDVARDKAESFEGWSPT